MCTDYLGVCDIKEEWPGNFTFGLKPNKDGKAIPANYFCIKTWNRGKLSIENGPSENEILTIVNTHSARQVRRYPSRYWVGLNNFPSNSQFPHRHFIFNRNKTTILWMNKKETFRTDYLIKVNELTDEQVADIMTANRVERLQYFVFFMIIICICFGTYYWRQK